MKIFGTFRAFKEQISSTSFSAVCRFICSYSFFLLFHLFQLQESAFILNIISENASFDEYLTKVQYLKSVCEFLAFPNSERLWNGEPSNIFAAVSDANTLLHEIVHHNIWGELIF